MTKSSAQRFGFCNKCASFNTVTKVPRCGVANFDRINCQLPAEVVERWKREHGLCGKTKESKGKDAFGKSNLIKRRRDAWGESKYKGE
jgi:hypothetical protein